MSNELQKWEYRVQSIGSLLGAKDELIQTTLDEWGEEGWEAFHLYDQYGGGKVTIVAKRPLTERARRLRSMPSQ
ncbi:MAG: hypothetical protein OZ914_11400 [Anaerolineaceae bacterium]|jgi:hypothetical protein|nr:hypothetical protein [Anaerolineaceae bacterium]